MNIDYDILRRFELGLDPQDLSQSAIPAQLLGYGEISAIFQIEGLPGYAFKRMPLFTGPEDAKQYEANYYEYCKALQQAGIVLPAHQTFMVERPGGRTVLYIAQQAFNPGDFCHKRIHSAPLAEVEEMVARIADRISALWAHNEQTRPGFELALDGQISNWVISGDQLIFVDTSTPLFRKQGVEQMDPELILQSAPSFLRAVIRALFLSDVMNRYYDRRKVLIDLAANLFKEQQPQLVPPVLAILNARNPDLAPITEKELQSYYREDKFIWWLFLNARRLDRWMTSRLLGKRYEFILPGKVRR